MKTTLYKWFALSLLAGTFSLTSCLGDLDLKPIDENIIQGSDFKNHPEYYIEQLAKVWPYQVKKAPPGNPISKGLTKEWPNIFVHIGICKNYRPMKLF